MFAKLLKHEWRSTRGLLGILSLAALGAGVLGVLALRLILSIKEIDMVMNPILTFVRMGLMIALGLGFVGLCIYSVAVSFLLLYRFYKHKFTDEGYLTFTLPVKTEEIYWSSMVNYLIWSVISLVVVIAVIAMVVLLGVPNVGSVLQEIIREIIQTLEIVDFEGVTGSAVLNLISGIVSLAYGFVLPYTCVTLGAVLVKKHKILAAFGMYYAISYGIGTLSSMATMVPTIFFLNSGSIQQMEQFMNITTIIETVLMAALAVGGYFLTIHLMKKKLNLP